MTGPLSPDLSDGKVTTYPYAGPAAPTGLDAAESAQRVAAALGEGDPFRRVNVVDGTANPTEAP